MQKRAGNRVRVSASNPEFALPLADGSNWTIAGDRAVRRQLGILGRVMSLGKGRTQGGARILLLPPGMIHDGTLESMPQRDTGHFRDLPRGGWKARIAGDVRCWYHPVCSDALCEIPTDMTPSVLYPSLNLCMAPLYRHAVREGGFPVHGALVEQEGRGYLLSGPSQQGKSTCCRRLPSSWTVLCDEQVLVLRGVDGGFLAHPLPTWNNFLGKGDQKSWEVATAVPLAGIFFLSKAADDAAAPLERAQAAILLYDAAMYKYRFAMAGAAHGEIRVERAALFGSTCDAAQQIPSFTLRASLHGRFWEEMEKVTA